ncbi:MAG: NADH-quinone oxidoreductase subunit J [bacterium]
MIPFLFFLFATVAIASAILMIVHRNPIYCALFLIVTLFSLAGLYVLLNAPFIAAVHMIVYAGAIMVLFLFVIMLLNLSSDMAKERSNRVPQVLGVLIAGLFLVELFYFVKTGVSVPTTVGQATQVGDTASIGKLLFTRYLFPFEIASVLLLSAIVGSVVLAKRRLRT